MTVKECILSIPFDEMAERLLAFCPQLEYSIAKFKEAYDIVRLFEPLAKGTGRLHVQLSSDPGFDLLMTPGVGYDNDWDYDLMREIEVDEGIDPRHLAMRLFYDLTYYGFSPDTINHHPDADELAGLEPNRYDLMLKQAQDEDERERLKNMSRRLNVMKRLTDGTTLSLDDIAFFEHSPAVYYADFISRCCDVKVRVGYIEELYTRYFKFPDDDTDFDRVILLVKTSSEFPLTDIDRVALDRLFRLFAGRQMTVGYGTENTLGQEMRIDMAFTWPEAIK